MRLQSTSASLALLLALLGSRVARADGATLTVQIVGLHSDKGQVPCELFLGPKGYPTDPKLAVQKVVSPIVGGQATCAFPGLAPGSYAVAVFHDENANNKLDTNFIGIPREGVGASNDAKGSMGPPPFEKAKFDVGAVDVKLTIHVKY